MWDPRDYDIRAIAPLPPDFVQTHLRDRHLRETNLVLGKTEKRSKRLCRKYYATNTSKILSLVLSKYCVA